MSTNILFYYYLDLGDILENISKYNTLFLTIILVAATFILSSSIIDSLNLNNKVESKQTRRKNKRNRDPLRVYLNKKPNSDFYLLTTNKQEYNSMIGLMSILYFGGVNYAEGSSLQLTGLLIPRSQVIEQGSRNRVLPPHIVVMDQRVVSGDFNSLRIGTNGGILTHGKTHFNAMYRS